MTNWKEISSDFTPKLQKEWENKGFSYDQCKEWINVHLTPEESDLAYYLTITKGYTPERFLEDESLIKYKEECKEWKKPKRFIESSFKEHLLTNSQENWFSTENNVRYKNYFPLSFWKNWRKEKLLEVNGYDNKPTVNINGSLTVPAKAKFYRWLVIFLVVFLLPLSVLVSLSLSLPISSPTISYYVLVLMGSFVSPTIVGLMIITFLILYFSHWFDTKIYFELTADGSWWEKEGVFLQFYKSNICGEIAKNICQWSNEVYEEKKAKDWKILKDKEELEKELTELKSQLTELQQNETNSEISEIVIANIENKLVQKEKLLVQKEQELGHSLRTSKKSTVYLRREIAYLKKMVEMKQALKQLKEKSEIFRQIKLEIILKEKEIKSIEEELEKQGYNKERGKKLREKESELTLLKKRQEELETAIMEQKRQLIINVGKIEVGQGNVFIGNTIGDNADFSIRNENIYQSSEQSIAQMEIAVPSQ